MLSAAVNRLWTPRLSLSSCVRGAMSRSTLGVELTDAQRWNFFPASPVCGISWWFAGRVELCAEAPPQHVDGPRRALAPDAIVFGGPHQRPTASWCPGPVHGMMLLLVPDALHLLTGLDPNAWLDRVVDAREVLPPDWIAMCEAARRCGEPGTAMAVVEEFLDRRWQAARPELALGAQRYQDWAQGLAMRAAQSAPGRSLRQVERRIKQWAGQPMRELVGIGRAEKAFFEVLAAEQRQDQVRWADIAVDTGYADQSHLCRVTRRITGFAPEELRRRIAEDEAFWAYRIWQ